MAFLVPSAEVSGCLLEIPSKCLFSTSSKNVRFDRISRSNPKSKKSVRVCSNIKDVEVRDPELGHELGWDGQFSATVKPSAISPPKQKKEEEEKQNYYANAGYAIRTLREEFPHLFYRELSFDIYRDDIVFKDPLNTFAGIENYKAIFWALRFHGRMFFKALWLDIISVWQPAEGIIMVRWAAHGILRVPWESHGRFDGVSEYKLDQKGKIYEHRVHNIALNDPPKFRVLAVEELIQSLGCPSTPKPTYFEISLRVMNLEPLLMKFTWVKDCLTSLLGFAQRSKTEKSQQS